ncbi:MAG: hypothetical protein H9893_05890 [Candidatus Niameybacter stercoravium]|nr:hypothetical protein [Candidatus Niameybacter stercoravium]
MINLFDVMKKLSEEELKEQGALLETLTMTNLSKQTSQKVAHKLVKATNLFAGLIKKEPFQTPEVLSIEERLEQNKQKWQAYTREETERSLKELLKVRCSKLDSSSVEEGLSEEAFSILILEEAGERYDLKEELLPSQKADFIAKFYQREIKEIRKELEKQKAEDKEDKEDREEYKEKDVEDTNQNEEVQEEGEQAGQEEGKEEQQEGEEISEIKCLMQLGLGRNKLIRTLFARWITLCVQACGGQMTVKEEALPSFQPPRERIQREHDYQELLRQHQRNEAEYEKVLHSLLEADQNLSMKNKVIDYEEKKQLEIQVHIEKLIEERKALNERIEATRQDLSHISNKQEANQLEQIEMQRLTKEVKMKEKQMNTYESMLAISAEEVESATRSIELINMNKEECIAPLLKKAADRRATTSKRLAEEEEKRQKDLVEKWQLAYKDFIFDEECLKSIQDFAPYELLDIERALLELYSVQDKKALSWGEVARKEYELFEIEPDGQSLEHMYLSLYGGEIIVLIYKVQEEINKVQIIKVLKV